MNAYTCHKCGEPFLSRNEAEAHLKTCEGSRPAPCSVTVLDEEHTFYCPECHSLNHSESIDYNAPQCCGCGVLFKIIVKSQNSQDRSSPD